jgi:hypothetical protein
VRSISKLLPVLMFGSLSSLAAAQTSLGELLEAGGKRMSAEEFRQEVVQRTIIGPTAAGAKLEMMYATNGSIQGVGTPPNYLMQVSNQQVRGEWAIDETERVCTAMQIIPPSGPVSVLPPRCQVWFKLGDIYFLSDSDSDRRAKVLPREIKPASVPVAGPGDLGQLLDAGAKKLSAQEFRDEIVQRVLVGPLATGGTVEIMYASNGVLQGSGPPPIAQIKSSFYGPIHGEWTIDGGNRVCSRGQIGVGEAVSSTLPHSCEYWFKLGDSYFTSDSDSDRHTKVLVRTMKQ